MIFAGSGESTAMVVTPDPRDVEVDRVRPAGLGIGIEDCLAERPRGRCRWCS